MRQENPFRTYGKFPAAAVFISEKFREGHGVFRSAAVAG
jgi:hypothetical protein